MVRVRIAPSPTGSPHVGTAFTTLFNYAFAKKHGGKFILRIEDTDRERLVPGAEEEIVRLLRWLSFSWDEGPDVGGTFSPYRQSERLPLYKRYARKLLEKGAATKEGEAVRMKVPRSGETKFRDLIRGEVAFKNEKIDQSILLKSDGFPTYHLGVVVDDYLMEITHVIRGEEWLPSTPKHILLYRAFGWEPPRFAHLPLLRTPKRAKLGKRFGHASLAHFRDEGFLPEALLNFLALQGWSHPEGKAIFPLSEMIKNLKLEDVNKAAPIFDLKKLEWMNGVYIRQKSIDELYDSLKRTTIVGKFRESQVKRIIPLVQERMKKLSEFEDLTDFFFTEEIKVDPKLLVQRGKTPRQSAQALNAVRSTLNAVSDKDWNGDTLEKAVRAFLAGKLPGWQAGQLFMTLRVALTGKGVSPPLFGTIETLGRERTLSRLKKAAELA